MPDEPSARKQFPAAFAIYELARTHRALAASMLRDLGLFPGQEIVLMRLWDRDGQSQNELGTALGLDHSTVAKSVRRMEEAGLVSRARSTTDGRVTVVRLTDAGREMERRVVEVWERLETCTVAGTSAQEMRAFVTTARAIEQRLRAGDRVV